MNIKIGGFLFIFFCFYSIYSSAQHVLSGKIKGYSSRAVNICSQHGDESKLVETVYTNIAGNFEFTIDSLNSGLYRIFLDTHSYFDIIYYFEDIHFETSVENLQYNMKIIKSKQNTQLYSYIVSNYTYDYKIDILSQLIDIYPDNNFKSKAINELSKEKNLKNKNLEKAIKIAPNSFAGKYLQYKKAINPPAKYNEYEKKEYILENYFSTYPINDIELLNSDAYSETILNYFKLFNSNDQEVYFQAAKTILDEIFFGDPAIFDYVFEFILSGFESLDLNIASAKLSLEYGNLCSEGNESLKMRIKSINDLSVGKIAPDIIAKSLSGDKIILSEMQSDYTLLYFWATWCEHCKISLPKLAQSQNILNQANIDVITISLDNDKQKLEDFLSNVKIPWKTICDFQSWEGKIVNDYAIFATPIMILVDKDLNIIARPYNEEKLYNVLEEILIAQ